ncbi:hypothetical protein BJ912DRAFT_1008191 [Pholiota molesta]|nr:hypothetical protein BJ912DRAFT_1008191 [Pholiota molesta]
MPFEQRPISPISPDFNQVVHSRRPSHEDGEIEASPPSAPYRPLASSVRPFPPKSRLFPTTNFVNPQSHSPPTGPRSSFLPSSGSPTPTFNGGGSTYRPPAATNATINRPAPPSAPRALRQSMLSNKPASTLPNNGSSSTSYGASQYIPRGPSADRDRDRDRDWDSRHYRGPRRGGGGGWSR